MEPLNVRCFDAGPEENDRYTIVYLDEYYPRTDTYSHVGSSENPNSPLGYFQHGECKLEGDNSHLGKEIAFGELPEAVRTAVLNENQ